MSSIRKNLLPFDGFVSYIPDFLNTQNADASFDDLMHSLNWKHDQVLMFGKKIITKRKIALYADTSFEYRYSKTGRKASLWTPSLFALKKAIESFTGEQFNCCLCNLYQDGTEGMGWHRDNESVLIKHGTIASLSLGANRPFDFKHIGSGDKLSFELHHGSMLVMKHNTQDHWLHQLPKRTGIKQPRINLTFRQVKKERLHE